MFIEQNNISLQQKFLPSPEERKTSGRLAQPVGQMDSLLYLNSNNGAEKAKLNPQDALIKRLAESGLVTNIVIDEFLSPYARKSAFVLIQNTEKFINSVGKNNVGFLTLTFKENVTDHKEAIRRFKSFLKHYLNKNFGSWMRISERQKRGAWHFHILVDCRQDIRTGVNFDEIYGKTGRKKYSSCSPYLRSLWQSLREACEKYGFGRSELLPIESNVAAMAKYIGKYLSKHNCWRDPSDKGIRLAGYSGKSTRSNTKFSWNTEGSKEWRKKLEKFAEIHEFTSHEEFNHNFGSSWAHKLRPFILLVDQFPPDVIKKMTSTMKVSISHAHRPCSGCGRMFLTEAEASHKYQRFYCSSCRNKNKKKRRKEELNPKKKSLFHIPFEQTCPPASVSTASGDLIDEKTGEVLF